MKQILALLAIALSCLQLHAQQNQAFAQKNIYASDYGTWQIRSQFQNTYLFQPANACTVPSPSGSAGFQPFATNAPVLINDATPGSTEVVTPVSVIQGASCGIVISPMHPHYSFGLQSATGGLQEALNQIAANGAYSAQVILDRNWYAAITQVPGSTAASIIGAAKGSAAAILADVTQAPTVFYKWNGSAYVAVPSGGGGGTIPATSNVLKGTGTAGSATAAQPGIDFVSPNAANGMGPQGTATSLTNFNSNVFNLCGSYFNGTGPAPACGTIQTTLTPGATPYASTTFGFNSPGGGQFNFPFSNFINGFTIQGFTSGAVQFAATAASGNYRIDLPPQNPNPGSTLFNCSPISSVECQGSWVAGGSGTSTQVTPQSFGGYGDAATIANGCTTNGTTSIVCPAAPFASGDIGKLLCVQGAGAAGVGFCSAIASVTSNTTVVVSAAPSTNVTTNPAVFGHDDVAAIQSCFNYSGSHGVQCILNPIGVFVNTAVGYLVYSAGLTIPTHANVTGNSYYGGTTIFSEFNGDLLSLPTSTASLAAGQPVSGVVFANIDLIHDPSWPNGRGIHLNAAPGIFGFGGMYYSTFTNVSDQSAALEALWMDGHTNNVSDDNPNQYIIFNNFIANGPNQSHPAAEIKMTGIQAQIIFVDGAINGTSNAFYPNPLIYIGEKTTGAGDAPGAVTFLEYTYEVGTQGLYVGNGSTSIHFDNGYVEGVESPLIVQGSVHGLTFRGNNVANSGNVTAVAQFSNSVAGTFLTATLQDNRVWGGTTPAAFAVCTGSTNNFAIDFLNNESTVVSTSNCATNHSGTGAALFQANGATATVDPNSVVITTILDPNVQPGKTLTLYALSGAPGGFSLGSGGTASGNAYPINLGANASPLVVTAGNSVVLGLLDQGGLKWTVIGGTGLPLTLGAARKGTFTCTAGGTITVSNTNVLATSDIPITMNTAGGTITTPPAFKTLTAGTGFTVLCGASDTSVYNYTVLD